MTFARYLWHVGMQLLCDVIAHTVRKVPFLCVSKKGWCIVVFRAVDLVRMDVCLLCQCMLKSTDQRRSGQL